MQNRPATNQEILDAHRSRVTGDYRRVSYRHFVREIYNPRSENGISHRQYSRSKLRDVNGVPHVLYQGEIHPVRATYYTLPSGSTFVALVELDSPYL